MIFVVITMTFIICCPFTELSFLWWTSPDPELIFDDKTPELLIIPLMHLSGQHFHLTTATLAVLLVEQQDLG